MKNLVIFLLVASSIFPVILSCSDDNAEITQTGVNGKPSFVEDKEGKIFFSYKGDRISQIREENNSILTFKYDESISSSVSELTSVSISPSRKDVADGNGEVSFYKSGNKITVESVGEPFFSILLEEIELDENMLPIKLTDLGQYTFTTGGLQKEVDGEYYTLFTFEPSTLNLLKEEVYEIATSKKVATYTYEYEKNPGAISKINLPVWFCTYWSQSRRGSLNGYTKLFYNYSNNISKIVVNDDRNNLHQTTQYTYDYNESRFPVSMHPEGQAGDAIKRIHY